MKQLGLQLLAMPSLWVSATVLACSTDLFFSGISLTLLFIFFQFLDRIDVFSSTLVNVSLKVLALWHDSLEGVDNLESTIALRAS